jgi:hypothetical protein
MTVNVTKPAINLREKLSELDKPAGIAGTEILRADTPQEVFNYINAGRRNLIINGAMQVAQRGTSSNVGRTTGYYTTDRWQFAFDNSLTELSCTMAQVSDAPDGFSNSLKITVDTPETSISGSGDEWFGLYHYIEGQNLQHLAYGTSSAKPITLSFWVKSSITGSYYASFYKNDTASSINTAEFTINSADTWEYKTITYSGLTSSGIDNNAGEGLRLWIVLACGPDRANATTGWKTYAGDLALNAFNGIATTSNATFQITGVQLEVGSVATPFEHRSYGEELALCQRYFIKHINTSFYNAGVSSHTLRVALPVEMRANPTITRVGSFWSGSEAAPTIGIYEKKAFMISGSTATYLGGNFTADAEL